MKRVTTVTEYEACGDEWLPVRQTVTEEVEEDVQAKGKALTIQVTPPVYPPYQQPYRPIWYSTSTNG